MGGFTFDEEQGEYEILDSVERFDISTQDWEFRASMVLPRADFGAGYVSPRHEL